MCQFQREIITENIGDYEKTHDVTSYKINGIAIWPIIRITSALALHAGVLRPFSNSVTRSVVSDHQESFFQILLKHIRHIYSCKNKYVKSTVYRYRLSLAGLLVLPLQHVPRSDIVIITNKNRQISWGSGQYNTVIDPLCEILLKKGIKPIVWEREGIAGRHVNSPSWQIEMQKFTEGAIPLQFTKKIQEPAWFNEIYEWIVKAFRVELTWCYIELQIRRILYFKHVVKPWLRKTKCKLIITDCWYNVDCLAFVLAASELELDIMDFQHGLQGEGHFAYQAWEKVPVDGYDYLPKKFWVWDEEDAKNLVTGGLQNIRLDDIIIGGNLWLEKWKRNDDIIIQENFKKASIVAKSWSRVVLVTLQKGVDNLSLIKAAVEKSSEHWLWLIRVHRNELENLSEFEKYFMQTGHAGVNLRDAVQLPLYTLFQIADLHVTGFSTCALEALSFDVPSIIAHESGKKAFQFYLDQGVMKFAGSASQLIDYAEVMMHAKPSASLLQCDMFCSSVSPEESVEKILYFFLEK